MLKTFIGKASHYIMAAAVLGSFIAGAIPSQVSAAAVNVAPQAKISFTFDDGYTSSLTEAAPVLAKYGFTGTNYVITDCVGMSTAPNTCHADNDATYMSWEQINQLKNVYGWEIGSHTASHPYLATSDPDDQPFPISFDQVKTELAASKAALNANGIEATSFAPPYGDYNMQTLAEIAKYYSNMRGFQDTGYNSWPYNEYLIRDQHVEGNVKVATVKSYIDSAIANNDWLVLTFHDIKQKASRKAYDYQYSTANLNSIAAYVKQKQDAGLIQASNVSDVSVSSDNNLLGNASFNDGISAGWSTNTPATVRADSSSKGSYPDVTSSINFSSGSTNSHLFSPEVIVDPNVEYVIKNYLYLSQINSGEIGFYIDEYDINGNWVSGQWKGAQYSVFAKNFNYKYKPTASNVYKSSLQVYTTPNSGINAYLDNVQWFSLSEPSLPPTPPPPPIMTNLMPNATFDNGIADGWVAGNVSQVKADSSNNGSPNNPVNSIEITALESGNVHLFSPAISVSSVVSYDIVTYLDVRQLVAGEIGFYIDEYDVNGNWISGQWKGARWSTSSEDTSLSYQPSSANVSAASLQIYVTSNSSIKAYVDDVRWYQ